MKTALLAVLLALETLSLSAARPQAGAKRIDITTVSTRADRVSGGDVLVRVGIPARPSNLRATLNGGDVTNAFREEINGLAGVTYLAVLTNLVDGQNTLRVSSGTPGLPDAALRLTNYPISVPIISGPHLKPFVCQTDSFKL